jgi:hypothetical protein
MDKETIAKILAHVEKNCTEVEEVEEYLWQLLEAEESEDSRNDCHMCGEEVGWSNLTSGGLCEECEYKGEYKGD